MRLSITAKLMLVSLGLLALPWLGLRYIGEMREFVLRGQLQAQVVAARALAAALTERPELADPPTGPGLYVYPLPGHVEVDGYAAEWEDLPGRGRSLGAGEGRYRVTLGSRDGSLYALVEVRDREVRYARPGAPGDQVRFRLRGSDGDVRELRVAPDGPGTLEVDQDAGAGVPRPWLQAGWQETPVGYRVELGLWPADATALEVLVDDAGSGTRPGSGGMLPLVRRCAPVEAMLARLGAGTEAVRVVDAGGWLRAAVGGGDGVPPARPDDPLLREALAGRSVSARRHIRYSGAQTLLVAAPVHAGGRVIGAVLVEQDSARVLGLQLHVFESVALASLGAMGLALGALLLFAWRLTWRIRRLGAETGRAIDPHGRVQADGVRHEVRAADELGDLARHISDMLRRLRRYTGFLERMPRTLRHEIDNPLNVIATSLHNYREQAPGTVGDTYLDSADRAVRRLGHIVRGMTEAASLEDELRRDPRVPLDLAALVSAYAESAAALHPACTVTYAGPAQGVTVTGSDLRLEQLLDKLLDNALDFTPKGGGIRFRLAPELGAVCLEVDNDGPPIPPAVAGSLFESMVSARAAPAPERPHLGLGLYLARLIAESHGGHITAATRADGGGVVFSVWIPAQ